jgi:hypothetical protein
MAAGQQQLDPDSSTSAADCRSMFASVVPTIR